MKKLLFTLLIILSSFIAQGQITFTTTSSDAGWSPVTVTKSGAVLTWSAASNGFFLGQTVNANDPIFDFSTNNGTAIVITVTSADGFVGLTNLDLWNDNGLGSQLTDVDVSGGTALTNLNTRYNILTSLDVTSNTLLTSLIVRGNSQLSSGTLDISNNTQLSFIQADATQLSSISLTNNTLLTDVRLYDASLTTGILDQIVIDLDTHGLLSGNLQITSNSGSLTSAALIAYNNLIAKSWTIDVPAPPAPSVDVITLTTTSTSATWSPATVTNSGAVLTWEASGGGITTQTINANDPTFDLSANAGAVTITITSTEGFAAVTNFDFFTPNAEITSIVDLDKATALTNLSTRYNLLTSLDVTSNTLLTSLNVRGNSQLSSGTLNISNNTQLTFIQADVTQLSSISLANNTLLNDVRLNNANLTTGELDQIVIDLDAHGLSSGNLQITGNPGSLSSSALIAYNSLIAKSWTIDVPAPPAAPGAEINVVGNAVSIVSGNIPALADHTNFGDVVIGVPQNHTFTIQNLGASNLIINFFFTSGTDFSFAPPGGGGIVLGTGATTTITATFTPLTTGIKTGMITINNTDPDEGTYIINLTANGINTPTNEIIDVIGNGNSITNGDITPSPLDDTDFGLVQSALSKTNTYTIENDGIDPLTITSILKALGGDPQFTVDNISLALPAILSPTGTAGSSMTFDVIFIPGAVGNYNAIIEIVNSDIDQTPFQFKVTGNGADVVISGDIMITQYYEGTTNSKWIEIKNISGTPIGASIYFLALYNDTDIPNITSLPPSTSIPIPAMAIDEVLLFKNAGASLPLVGNLGGATQIITSVCNFDGNDIILISGTDNATCYANRQDIIGTLATSPSWGDDRSYIRGGTNESPESNFNINNWILISASEVDNANPNTNIALGSQHLGATAWTGASWDNLTPDRTRTTTISAAYSAANGTFTANDLTINSSLNFDNNTTNSVVVYGSLTISSAFTIGDTESLVMYDGSATITGNITKLEESTSRSNQFDITYWSSPITNASIGAVFSGVSTDRIFLFDQLQTTDPESHDGWLIASGSMIRGKGYAADGPTGTTGVHSLSFTGQPTNGSVSIELRRHDADGELENDYNLIGNPYPSAISVKNFLDNNANIGGAIYLWTHTTPVSGGTFGDYVESDYATRNGVGGTNPNGGPIPGDNLGSSQGFMVSATSSGFVNFTNSMRILGDNDDFYKSGNSKKKAIDEDEIDRIWLNINTDQGGSNQLLIGFVEKATKGVDRIYDAPFLDGGNPISFYSHIENENAKYVIQGLGTYSVDKTISLGFDTKVAPRTFTISMKRVEGQLKDAEVYLVDHVLNIVHDLKKSDYQFEQTIIGENPKRFTLQFAGLALSVDDIIAKEDFIVSNEYDGLRIRSSKTVQSIRVYDLLGRMLIQQKPNEKSFNIRTGSIKVGTILLLEATLENGSVINRKTIKY